MTQDSLKLGLKPLKMTCTTADCVHGMHCFIPDKKLIKTGQVGICRDCGSNPVDWKRVHQRNINDIEFTVTSLQLERVRNEFWHKRLDPAALAYAAKKGKTGLREVAEHRIRKYLPPVYPRTPTFDGRQTRKSGNPVFYAQHATATCCRKCILEWHGIPKDTTLSDAQISYLTSLVIYYLDKRLPNLSDNPPQTI
jgi:hypothetical protein